MSNQPGIVVFDVGGDWTPGTFGPATGTGPFTSSFMITFTQSPPGAGNPISDPFTFSVPPAVPELSTWAMMLLGFAGLGCVVCRRRGLLNAT